MLEHYSRLDASPTSSRRSADSARGLSRGGRERWRTGHRQGRRARVDLVLLDAWPASRLECSLRSASQPRDHGRVMSGTLPSNPVHPPGAPRRSEKPYGRELSSRSRTADVRAGCATQRSPARAGQVRLAMAAAAPRCAPSRQVAKDRALHRRVLIRVRTGGQGAVARAVTSRQACRGPSSSSLRRHSPS